MRRFRRVIPPGQMTLDLFREHPDALRIVATRTGRPVAVLPGRKGLPPTPVAVGLRRVA